MTKVDLHTHSHGSPDGGLQVADYRQALESGQLDFIAITDHNSIEIAQAIQKELGERICVGEEIMTTHGELIGLFLREAVPAGLTPLDTAKHIKAQGGLVYVPHPFETVRSGIDLHSLNDVAQYIDIVEVYNGRAMFQDKSAEAREWAAAHNVPVAASSDAHGQYGWMRTYSELAEQPTAQTLKTLLIHAHFQTKSVGLGILYPKLNRIRRLHK